MLTVAMLLLGTLALPKLNLQFLTVHDYLLRNFHLFRLESTCMLTRCIHFELEIICFDAVQFCCWRFSCSFLSDDVVVILADFFWPLQLAHFKTPFVGL